MPEADQDALRYIKLERRLAIFINLSGEKWHTIFPISAKKVYNGVKRCTVFFYKAPSFEAREARRYLEQPAWHLPRQGRGFIRPPVRPMSPSINYPYGEASGFVGTVFLFFIWTVISNQKVFRYVKVNERRLCFI